jgi:hypothetical protein
VRKKGGGIHLDQHTDRAPLWTYGRIPDESRRRIADGLRGIAPTSTAIDAQRARIDRGGASTTRVEGDGKIRVDFTNVPRGVSTRAEAGGIFKNVEMTRSKQMPQAAGGPAEALPDGGPF